MEALQAQIEPHFLFNTLASIDQLIQTDPPRASRMQQSLIRYLRWRCRRCATAAGPHSQQINLAAPSEIMSVNGDAAAGRHVPRLEVRGLPLMLQPQENAIKHGLEPKLEGGRLEIALSRQRPARGSRVGRASVSPKAEGGAGLANVRERLKAMYNGRAGHQRAAGRTCATIGGPMNRREPAASLTDNITMRSPASPPSSPTMNASDAGADCPPGSGPELATGEKSNGREAVALAQSHSRTSSFSISACLDGRHPGGPGAGRPAHVVFVTAHDHYAISAFEQGASTICWGRRKPSEWR
jgi:hypothetical protein